MVSSLVQPGRSSKATPEPVAGFSPVSSLSFPSLGDSVSLFGSASSLPPSWGPALFPLPPFSYAPSGVLFP